MILEEDIPGVNKHHHADQEKTESGGDVAQAVQRFHHTDGVWVGDWIRAGPAGLQTTNDSRRILSHHHWRDPPRCSHRLSRTGQVVVHVGSIGCGLNTAQLRQARNMRVCHAGRTSQVSWPQTEPLQPISHEQGKFHGFPVEIA